MSIFSKTCEYGLRATLYIAQCSLKQHKTSLKEIAAEVNSPEPFLGKILQNLTRKGFIQSTKGPKGGFYMDAENLKNPLSEIVKAIDGEALFEGCALGMPQCSSVNPCPLHEEFKQIRGNIKQMLDNTTIEQFSTGISEGRYFLKN